MTEPTAAQLARLAKLESGRSAPAQSARQKTKRRRHPAQGSRILAAGLGAGTMFGIVTVLGLNNPISQAEEPTPTPATQPAVAAPAAPVAPPVEVRVHMIPSTATLADQEPSADPAPMTQTESAPAGPIELTANPVVRTVTVAAPTARPQAAPSIAAPQAAPVATTSGSS